MAEFQGPKYKTVLPNGEYGNARVVVLPFLFVAATHVASSIALLGMLPGSCKIHRVTAKSADMGGAQTMDIGYRYITDADGTSDPDGFFDGIDTGTAAAVNTFNGPVDIAAGDGVEILAQNLGAAATGQLYVTIEYEWLGQ